MKRWKCTVCGYIHEGDKPPVKCPQCGADMYQFILYQALTDELEQIVRLAFAAESKANVRNQAFAARAEAEGYPQVAALFKAVAEAERVHASEYLKYLEGVVGSTEENLQRAFENEMKAKDDAYPELIKQAFAAKRDDLAWSFIRSRDVEERHAALYKSALSALAGERDIEYHVCEVCGYVFEDEPPDTCPVCKSGRDKFRAIK
jgi:rubrerythrin